MSPHNLFLPILAQSDPQRTTGSGIPINNDANKPVWYFDDMGLVAGIALAIMVALAVVAALIKKQGASNTKGKAFRHIPDTRKIDKNSPNGDPSHKKKTAPEKTRSSPKKSFTIGNGWLPQFR